MGDFEIENPFDLDGTIALSNNLTTVLNDVFIDRSFLLKYTFDEKELKEAKEKALDIKDCVNIIISELNNNPEVDKKKIQSIITEILYKLESLDNLCEIS